MDLVQHLRYFVAVAEELHFGRAAARLHMAQPPLSQRIQRLERHLGVRLFDRSPRSVNLTVAGGRLLAEAQELLQRVSALDQLADRLRADEISTLRVGLPADLPGTTVAAVAAEFAARHPSVTLRMQEAGPVAQRRALVERRLDAGVLRLPFDTAHLTLGAVVRRPLGVLIAGDDPAATSSELLLSNLSRLALVIFRRAAAPSLYDEILDTCARHGYRPTTVHEVSNADFGRGLVLAGGAVTFDDSSTPAPVGTVWRPLLGEPLTQRLTTAWPRGRDSALVRAFAEAVTAVLCRDGMSLVDSAGPRPMLRARPTAEFIPWSRP